MKALDGRNKPNQASASVLAALPNLLSLARLLMGLTFPWIPSSWRLGVLVAAALSDLLDGASSRRFHVTSTTGRILDPVADKVFVLGVLVTLRMEDLLEVRQLLLVGFRDFAVLVGAGSVVMQRGWSTLKQMPPSWLGKITTAAQFAFILSVLYYHLLIPALYMATVALSVGAGLDYLRRYWTSRDESHGPMPR